MRPAPIQIARRGDDDASAIVPGGAAAPAGIPAEIFAAAVDTFVAGQRLDMRSLARRLGVARATLYRRAGNRDQLLDEMLWWRARHLLVEQVQATASLAGTDRLVAMLGRVLRASAGGRAAPADRHPQHRAPGHGQRAGEAHRPGARPRLLRRPAGHPDAGLRDRADQRGLPVR